MGGRVKDILFKITLTEQQIFEQKKYSRSFDFSRILKK